MPSLSQTRDLRIKRLTVLARRLHEVGVSQKLQLRCSGCGRVYTWEEWMLLPTVPVPALTIPVVMRPEEVVPGGVGGDLLDEGAGGEEAEQ